MALEMPRVRAEDGMVGVLTLKDLRDLVAATTGLADDLAIRANASFRPNDLFNPDGVTLSMMTVAAPIPEGQ